MPPIKNNESIVLDLNNPEFQEVFFKLEKEQAVNVIGTLRKIRQMTWGQVYADRGLKWELIHAYSGKDGEKRYSFRIGKGFRAVAFRDQSFMRILGLYPDHDSAYDKRL